MRNKNGYVMSEEEDEYGECERMNEEAESEDRGEVTMLGMWRRNKNGSLFTK